MTISSPFSHNYSQLSQRLAYQQHKLLNNTRRFSMFIPEKQGKGLFRVPKNESSLTRARDACPLNSLGSAFDLSLVRTL